MSDNWEEQKRAGQEDVFNHFGQDLERIRQRFSDWLSVTSQFATEDLIERNERLQSGIRSLVHDLKEGTLDGKPASPTQIIEWHWAAHEHYYQTEVAPFEGYDAYWREQIAENPYAFEQIYGREEFVGHPEYEGNIWDTVLLDGFKRYYALEAERMQHFLKQRKMERDIEPDTELDM